MTNKHSKNKTWLRGIRSGGDIGDLRDEAICCIDCGASFSFSRGEQIFYMEHRIPSAPQRCKSCRDKRSVEKISKGYPMSKKRFRPYGAA